MPNSTHTKADNWRSTCRSYHAMGNHTNWWDRVWTNQAYSRGILFPSRLTTCQNYHNMFLVSFLCNTGKGLYIYIYILWVGGSYYILYLLIYALGNLIDGNGNLYFMVVEILPLQSYRNRNLALPKHLITTWVLSAVWIGHLAQGCKHDRDIARTQSLLVAMITLQEIQLIKLYACKFIF